MSITYIKNINFPEEENMNLCSEILKIQRNLHKMQLHF
jgi:hypothetical protein